MSSPGEATFIDSWVTRALALIIAIGCGAGIYLVHQSRIETETVPQSTGIPALDDCIAERVGAVDAMRSSGVIDDRQYDSFKTRAIQFCEGQFGG